MTRNLGILSTLLSALLLSGVVHAQATAPKPPPAPPPTTDSGLPAMPDVKDPMLDPIPPAENALSSWKDALRHIHMRSTELHTAQARIQQAGGVSRSALAPALPRLSTSGTVSHLFTLPEPNRAGVPADQFLATLDLRQSVLNLPAWNNIGTARELERSVVLTEKDTERNLISAVAQAAVSVITNERIAESNRVSLALALSTADIMKRRAALGSANALDVLRIEQDVSTARALVVTGDETLRQARESLAAALGYTGQWGVAPTVRIEDLQQTATQICRPIQTIDGRADVRAAAKSLDAAKSDKKTVDYAFVPTVDVSSQAGYFSFPFRSPSLDHWAWFAGATATWLIFDGGDRYGQRRQKEAAEAIAREQLTLAQRNAALQTTRAERGIQVARARLDVSTKTRDIAKEQARLSRIAFINGSGTSLELVDSTSRLRAAEIDLLNKQFGVFQAELAAFLAKADCAI